MNAVPSDNEASEEMSDNSPSPERAALCGARIEQVINAWYPLQNSNPLDFQKAMPRYAAWQHALLKSGAIISESLLPRLITNDSGELPPGMRLANRPARPELLEEIQFYKWGYYFYLGNGASTIGNKIDQSKVHRKSRQRSLYRLNMINKAVSALYGSDLSRKTVLDLGCNWGAFALDLAARGAGSVQGVDLRPENVLKAELLRDYLGLERVQFKTGNVFDFALSNKCDVVLCLGLLYHVTAPYQLLKRAYDLTNEICVVDTRTHKEPFSGFILHQRPEPLSHADGEIGAELHPTYRGLIDLMHMVGFRNLIELEGTPHSDWLDWDDDVYARRHRRCVVGFK